MKKINQIKLIAIIAVTIMGIMSGCMHKRKVLHKNSDFTILSDGVIQDKYTAKVISDKHIVSNYKSKASSQLMSNLEYKFSINGKDNELPFGVNHLANVYSENGETVIINVVFGKKTVKNLDQKSIKAVKPNTKVKFRLDMSEVMNAFEKDGHFTDIHGEKIFKKDFKGVFIAGAMFPLSWDFENLISMKGMKLEDTDGDKIFEVEFTFNVYNPDDHVSSEWKLKNDISKHPEFESDFPLLNAIYNMTLDEVEMLKEADGTFRTGEKWAGVWTRDVSYSIVLALATIEPEIAMTSMMKKVKNNRIIQDTGTGGAWPVSSDRVVWALAAWEIYKTTGDKEWLKKTYQIIKNSVDDDFKVVYDRETGLMRGESSFLDWRKQTYPLWMQPADIYGSMNLGTNAAYCKVLNILSQMEKVLGVKDNGYNKKSESLKANINKWLWSDDNKWYGQYLYGRKHKTLSPRSEALGEAFTILYDIADDDKKFDLLTELPILNYGIPCIYPQIPGISPYHNNGIWPFVEAFWTIACAKEKNDLQVENGFASMFRQAALFLTNKENMVAEDGDFAGTVLNSDRQLWSVAGQLAMMYKVIFGMQPKADRLVFTPVIPKSFDGKYELKNFKYRKAILNIEIEGSGIGIVSFKIDGKESKKHEIPSDLIGEHKIEILMNGRKTPFGGVTSLNVTSLDTPHIKYENGYLKWNKVDKADSYAVFKNGKLVEKVKTLRYKITDNKSAEYQVIASEKWSDDSFLSNPVVAGKYIINKKIQLENFNYKVNSTVGGFNGNGYIEVNLRNNEALNFNYTAPVAGVYHIQFRYANGSGPINTDNKCCLRSLYVNGEYTESAIFPQRGKDEWSNWGYTPEIKIALKKGINNLSLKFDSFNRNMNGEVNRCFIDEAVIRK